jgi:transcription initiation factor TFIIH subunit 2
VDSSDGEGSKLNSGGYFCPQCCSKYCELPVECKACGLTLVSAPHLARSYHHLFPVENFKELEFKDMQDKIELCFACQKTFGEHDKHVSMIQYTILAQFTLPYKSYTLCFWYEIKNK